MTRLQNIRKFPETMTLKDAAEYLGFERHTFAKHLKRSGIPFAKGDRRYYFSKSALDAWKCPIANLSKAGDNTSADAAAADRKVN